MSEIKSCFAGWSEAYFNNKNYFMSFRALLNILKRLQKEEFLRVKRMLFVDAGKCGKEIFLLRFLLPNLEEVVFVGQNGQYATEIKMEISKLYPDKEIKCTFIKTPALEWENKDKVDLVLMLSTLFGLGRSQRENLLKTCFEKWLDPKGTLCLSLHNNIHLDKNISCFCNKVYTKMGLPTYADISEVKEILNAMGKHIEERPFLYTKDKTDYNDDFLEYVQHFCPEPRSIEEIKEAIKEVEREGYVGIVWESFCIVTNNV